MKYQLFTSYPKNINDVYNKIKNCAFDAYQKIITFCQSFQIVLDKEK